VRTVDTGPGDPPDYYLDDLQFEQTGEALTYVVAPRPGTWFYVDGIHFALAGSLTGVLADATMLALDYRKLGPLATLTSGLLYQRFQMQQIQLVATFYGIGDWLQHPNSRILSAMSDGTKALITWEVKYPWPTVLKAELADELRYVVRDDLSSLDRFRIMASGRERELGDGS
jgi:hypothetical protein